MNKPSEDFEYKPGSQSKLMGPSENTGRIATRNDKNCDKEWILFPKRVQMI